MHSPAILPPTLATAHATTWPWHRHKVYLSNESGQSSGILEKGEVHGGWIRPGRPEWHIVGVECVWSSIFASTGIFGTDARKRSQLAVTQCAAKKLNNSRQFQNREPKASEEKFWTSFSMQKTFKTRASVASEEKLSSKKYGARAARQKKIQTCSFQKFKTPNVQEFFKTLISTLTQRSTGERRPHTHTDDTVI